MRLALAIALAACSSSSKAPRDAGAAAAGTGADADAGAAPGAGAGAAAGAASCGQRQTLAEGLELLSIVLGRAPAVDTGDRCLRALRADPARYRVALGAAERDGATLTAPQWAARHRAVGVINASMFHEGGESTGLLIDGAVLGGAVNRKFGAFFAANPKHPGAPAVRMWGRGCPGGSIEALRSGYRTVVQNYRLLDCGGGAIAWADEKVYSAAAVGVDRAGRVLFIHLRAPYRMSDFAAMLADPATGLDLAAAMYVEGGPEATLFAGGQLWVGSYETAFMENDSNSVAWPLPNVLMLVPR